MKKVTIETFARERNLGRQSAINLLSKMKKEGLVQVNGGGSQKRIYTITEKPVKKTNGFYDIVNKSSPEKLVPQFKHYTIGNYTIEHAIIDGLKIGDVRTKEATMYLFNKVKNWKRLFDLAKKHKLTSQVLELYSIAKTKIKVRKMPLKYINK